MPRSQLNESPIVLCVGCPRARACVRWRIIHIRYWQCAFRATAYCRMHLPTLYCRASHQLLLRATFGVSNTSIRNMSTATSLLSPPILLPRLLLKSCAVVIRVPVSAALLGHPLQRHFGIAVAKSDIDSVRTIHTLRSHTSVVPHITRTHHSSTQPPLRLCLSLRSDDTEPCPPTPSTLHRAADAIHGT